MTPGLSESMQRWPIAVRSFVSQQDDNPFNEISESIATREQGAALK